MSGSSSLSIFEIWSLSSSFRFFSRCSCSWSNGSALGESRDHVVEVAMLGLQGGELRFQGF